MKIHKKLDEILSNGLQVKILRFMFLDKDEHTGRDLAHQAGVSTSSAQRILQGMKSFGILSMRKKGNAVSYSLKEDNYFVKKVLRLVFESEKAVYADVCAFVKAGFKSKIRDICALAVFGSTAIRKEKAKSDLDLLVVASSDSVKKLIEDAAIKLSTEAAKEFSVALSPYVVSRTAMRQEYAAQKPLFINIVKNHDLIYGEPLERIVA
jgi:predicted nucleotidyltransferase